MNNVIKKTAFQIGGFCFSLTYPEEIHLPEHFKIFKVSEGEPQYFYEIRIEPALPALRGTPVAAREDLCVFSDNGLEARQIGIRIEERFFACYEEISKCRARIIVDSASVRNLPIDTVFVSLLALERRMIRQSSLILHCAYIRYQGEAILFSAPSETGKSTQAELWERYRGSRTVNGDRALLRKADNRWMACGWPICGSSEICHLGDTPIRAIVMLRQGTVNQVVRLSPVQAFSLLYAQITVNSWNPDFVSKALDALENLIAEIPIFELTCDISEDAVSCLENVLFL